MMRKKIKKVQIMIKLLARMALAVFCVLSISLLLLYRVDTKTLWGILPGIHSSQEVREFSEGMVSMAEHLPVEDEAAYSLGSGMMLTGTIGMAAQTAREGSVHDQILSQYTLALCRSRLLLNQGDFSETLYQLYKLPFKTGNTRIMQMVLPSFQKKNALPEGFLSKEDVDRQEAEKREADQQLRQYKEENLYGRYYQYGNFNSYLELQEAENGEGDVIRFVLISGEEEMTREEAFRYQRDRQEYRTTGSGGGHSEFVISGDDEIVLNQGGFEAPARFIKPNDGDFVIPDSNVRRVSREELEALDERERWIAKNEIYARHGYPFQNEELRQHFSQCRWYRRGEFSPDEFQESSFSEVERDNLKLMLEMENP